MRKALLVIPDLGYSGAARQVALLARGLPRDRVEPVVCVLGQDGPVGGALRAEGVRVEALGWRSPVDVGGPLRLRRLLAELRPDVVHAWKPAAVRALALAGWPRSGPVVASKPLRAGPRGPSLGRLDRWLLRRAGCVVAGGPAEAERCRRLGVAEHRLRVVPPGVEAAGGDGPGAAEADGGGRSLVCVGPLEAHKGYREAVWAFDMLRRLRPGLRLLLAGAGPYRPRLEGFVATLGLGEVVRFLGPTPDLAGVLAGALAVWVPSRAEGGAQTALEAMAAGRPVVASRLPGLAEVVADGETGFLVPPGDKVALARRTRLLLDDAARRRGMGEAGRRRAARDFAAAAFVRRVAALYGGGATGNGADRSVL